MLMAEVLQFWHISCRFDIENMEWALAWHLLKLCKLSNIYAPKASASAWDFAFNNFFFWTCIYIYIYIHNICLCTCICIYIYNINIYVIYINNNISEFQNVISDSLPTPQRHYDALRTKINLWLTHKMTDPKIQLTKLIQSERAIQRCS